MENVRDTTTPFNWNWGFAPPHGQTHLQVLLLLRLPGPSPKMRDSQNLYKSLQQETFTILCTAKHFRVSAGQAVIGRTG